MLLHAKLHEQSVSMVRFSMVLWSFQLQLESLIKLRVFSLIRVLCHYGKQSGWGRFISTHCFRGILWQEEWYTTEQSLLWQLESRENDREGPGTRYSEGSVPSDVLPPVDLPLDLCPSYQLWTGSHRSWSRKTLIPLPIRKSRVVWDTISLHMMRLVFSCDLRTFSWDWRDGSVFKSGYSSRRLRFEFQHLHGSSQLYINSVPGEPTLFLALIGT